MRANPAYTSNIETDGKVGSSSICDPVYSTQEPNAAPLAMVAAIAKSAGALTIGAKIISNKLPKAQTSSSNTKAEEGALSREFVRAASISWAWTSTPGIAGCTGVVFTSNKPIAEVPTNTSLPENAFSEA